MEEKQRAFEKKGVGGGYSQALADEGVMRNKVLLKRREVGGGYSQALANKGVIDKQP